MRKVVLIPVSSLAGAPQHHLLELIVEPAELSINAQPKFHYLQGHGLKSAIKVADYPEELSEGNSAELGLALVLLMAASSSPYRQVIATGKLSGQTQLIRERDVKILPVSKLEEKFNLVIQQVTQGQLPRDKELLFFIPKYCNQGESAVEVENRPEV
jgi:hypothetical protein